MQQSFGIPRGLALAGCTATLLLAACGGGGGGGGTNTGNSGGGASATAADTTVGPITGFGSIIVNGVRFEDNAARVNDDSGNAISSSDLRLGMTVEIRGSIGDDGTGTASDISLFSELKGPLSNLDTTAGTFTVLGFTIVTDGATVYDDVSGLSALANGDFVEVYGVRSGSVVTASRIEKKDPTASADLKLRGQISNLNTGTTTFTLGTATVNYGSASVLPSLASLVDGAYVAVRSSSTPSGTSVQASRVQVIGNVPFSFDDGGKLEIHGAVSSFTSISSFVVSGITVDASNAVFLRGSAGDVTNGTLLEVEGPYSNGVLTATKAKFEDFSGVDEFELHGTVSNFVSLASFQVRGVTVDASGNVSFERGTAADVANGRSVEVEGSVQSGTDGSILVASKLKFEDVSGNGGSDDNGGSSGSDDNGGSSGSDDNGGSSGSGSGASGDDNSGSGSGGSSSAGGEFEFKGTVSSVSGNTLVVGGRTVTITSSTSFRRITQAQLVAGAFVEIKGTLQSDGSVVADRISLED
ncbi:MAG: hypothetical protein KDG55_08100 [Rhodocyclaceae bacterium]|nr:hypothetical protein [Rhodocyclaceae bacterium]